MTPIPTTKDNAHIIFLDHIRGIAILAVFFGHAAATAFFMATHSPEFYWNGTWNSDLTGCALNLLMGILSKGWVGVPIFFVVSGFCIHLSFQRSRLGDWKEFFIRRFFRIYPPYFISLLFFALIFPYSRLHFGIASHDLSLAPAAIRSFIGHIFMIHHFEIGPNDVNPPFWSVAVEVKLYLLYPVLLWLAFRFGWLTTICLTGAVELGMRTFECLLILKPAFKDSYWYLDSPLYFWFSWSIGAWLAEAYLKGHPLPFRKIPIILWPLGFIVCWQVKPLVPFCFTLASLSTAYIISALLRRLVSTHASSISPGWIRIPLEHLRQTGIVSYSAYLLHYPILNWILALISVKVLGIFNEPVSAFLAFLMLSIPCWFAIFLWSRLYHQYIELVSIRLGSKMIQLGRSPDP